MIICIICSLQVAVASDIDVNNTDNLKTTPDFEVVQQDSNVSTYSLPDSDQNLQDGSGSVGTFSELQNDIVNGKLTKNYTYDSSYDSELTNGIVISQDMTIEGEGNIVINANKQARVFNIASGTTVTLKGITFINGNADGNGGSIISNGIINIINCNFINNTASGHGGAIYLDNSVSSTITGCDFTGNTAGLNGGAVDWHAGSTNGMLVDSTFTNNTAKRSGGAIHWSGHYGTIRNTNFTNNNATGDVVDEIGGILGGGDGGAVIWVGSHGTIKDNCNFINNTAKYRGGAIFLHGNSTENCTNITIDNSIFKYNTAGLNGGAINWQEGSTNGRLTNSIFINNTAARNGGAVFWFGYNGTVINCNFTNNSAIGTVDTDDRTNDNYIDNNGNIILGGSGGAIVWTGNIGIIDNCNFIHNYAVRLGGAVFLRDNDHTSFRNSHFTNNTAGLNGGAIDFNRGAHDGSIINSTFNNNIANRSAGAVFWFGDTGRIINSNFTNNKALGIKNYTDSYGNITYGGYGGAIMWTGSNGIVEDCKFISNEAQYNIATDSGGRGGAIYLQGSLQNNVIVNCTNTTFNRCIFIDNFAGTNGGAVDWHEGAHNGNIFNCTFQHNIANANGGAVYWRGHDGEIFDSNFTNNIAKGLYAGSYGNVGDGGAIFWAGINGAVKDCRFIENEAINNSNYDYSGRGGAVYIEPCNHGNRNTTFDRCNFTGNIAGTNGGAIEWHAGAHDGKVSNSIFDQNIAKRSGGLYIGVVIMVLLNILILH